MLGATAGGHRQTPGPGADAHLAACGVLAPPATPPAPDLAAGPASHGDCRLRPPSPSPCRKLPSSLLHPFPITDGPLSTPPRPCSPPKPHSCRPEVAPRGRTGVPASPAPGQWGPGPCSFPQPPCSPHAPWLCRERHSVRDTKQRDRCQRGVCTPPPRQGEGGAGEMRVRCELVLVQARRTPCQGPGERARGPRPRLEGGTGLRPAPACHAPSSRRRLTAYTARASFLLGGRVPLCPPRRLLPASGQEGSCPRAPSLRPAARGLTATFPGAPDPPRTSCGTRALPRGAVHLPGLPHA